MILKAIRLLLLALSFLGYMNYANKKIRAELAVGVIFSGMGCVMFMAGILNVLTESAVVIFVVGLYLLVRAIICRDDLRRIIRGGTVFFVVFCGVILVLLYGSEFTHYDNFSHWAIALKSMIRTGRFPTDAESEYILFQSYPLGSASFIYYFVCITGIQAEWFQMWVQAILIAGMLVSIFVFAKSAVSAVLAGAVVLVLFCANTSYTDLLVDTLLPATAIAAVVFCTYYRKKMGEKIWCYLPFLGFLTSIKNSGLLFVFFAAIYSIVQMYRYTAVQSCEKHKDDWFVACVIFVPMVFLLLWQKHVSLVFSHGLSSKHSLSLENYLYTFSRKDLESLMDTFVGIMKQMLSLDNPILLLLIGAICFVVLFRVVLKVKVKGLQETIVWMAVFYLVYQIGMILMYLFSMPSSEAAQLAGYERYHRTIVIFAAGIWLARFIQTSEAVNTAYKTVKTKLVTAILAIACLMVICCVAQPEVRLKRQKLEGTQRSRFDTIISDYEIEDGKRYAVVVNEKTDATGYITYMTKYLLLPQKSDVISIEDVDEQFVWDDYDYVIAFDQSEEIVQYMASQFGVSGSPVYTK